MSGTNGISSLQKALGSLNLGETKQAKPATTLENALAGRQVSGSSTRTVRPGERERGRRTGRAGDGDWGCAAGQGGGAASSRSQRAAIGCRRARWRTRLWRVC